MFSGRIATPLFLEHDLAIQGPKNHTLVLLNLLARSLQQQQHTLYKNRASQCEGLVGKEESENTFLAIASTRSLTERTVK